MYEVRVTCIHSTAYNPIIRAFKQNNRTIINHRLFDINLNSTPSWRNIYLRKRRSCQILTNTFTFTFYLSIFCPLRTVASQRVSNAIIFTIKTASVIIFSKNHTVTIGQPYKAYSESQKLLSTGRILIAKQQEASVLIYDFLIFCFGQFMRSMQLTHMADFVQIISNVLGRLVPSVDKLTEVLATFE